MLKAGLPAWAAVGDPNAAVDTAQPLVLGPQFAGSGAAPADVSVVFVNAAAAAADGDAVPTRRRRVARPRHPRHRAGGPCSAATPGRAPSAWTRAPGG